MPKRLAIVTQDPTNYGGVLRLVEYVYKRAEAGGVEPSILHYGRFAEHPDLSASFFNLLRGELNVSVDSRRYDFRGMRAIAIGAYLPEWEPNRIKSHAIWRSELSKFDAAILVTGSAHAGLQLAELEHNFVAWVSSTIAEDRAERLGSSKSISNLIERLGLLTVMKAERRVLTSARRILAVSNDARSHLRPLAESAIEVWPFPIATDTFIPDSGLSEHIQFLFVGRANDPRKRVQLFLDACYQLRDYDPSLKFKGIVISSEPPGDHDRTLIQVLSRVAESELITLYQSSTALVLTSEQEGLGIAAMEAMACGLPVISTRCGGPETFIEDNISGLFVTAAPHKIAEAMHELASNRVRRLQMGVAARARIEASFSERVWNPKFDELINDLTK